MTKCFICESVLSIEKLSCTSCNTSYQGTFLFSRLSRLTKEEQHLTESLIIHGGNLKEMAEELNLSYPTLKKRLKDLTHSLEKNKEEDENKIEEILFNIEAKKMSAEEGIKLIREINGEL